jgi:Short C-terminal domain
MGVPELEAWYSGGFGAAAWPPGSDGWIKGCELQLDPERLILKKGAASINCPWPAVSVKATPSKQGNAVLEMTLAGEQGGTAKIVLPNRTPAGWWAEVWRAVPAIRELNGWKHLRPATVSANRPISVLMQYLGGYPLYPRKAMTGLVVEFDGFGVALKSGVLRHVKAFVPWADMTGIAVDGMLDAQRQRSLAPTVEFGALGGLAGKKVKSSYLMIGTRLGDLIFHAEKMTAPELQAKVSPIAAPAQQLIAARRQPSAAPVPQRARTPTADIPDQIARLAELHKQGILTEEEFAAKKAELLSRI